MTEVFWHGASDTEVAGGRGATLRYMHIVAPYDSPRYS